MQKFFVAEINILIELVRFVRKIKIQLKYNLSVAKLFKKRVNWFFGTARSWKNSWIFQAILKLMLY